MKVAVAIDETVMEYARELATWPEEKISSRPASGKWGPKEILGHLIDSAQNNIQRFVRAQYEETPRIVYAQNEWVALQSYHDYPTGELILLWISLNKHLCRILVRMDPANYERQVNMGKDAAELHPLSFVAEDYHRHMQHHLNQIKERV